MLLRRSLRISAVLLVGIAISAWGDNLHPLSTGGSKTPAPGSPNNPPAPPNNNQTPPKPPDNDPPPPASNKPLAPIVRTYLFPASGFAPSSETVRVTVVNIAPNGHNGNNASCDGAIQFNDASGKPLEQPAVPFKNLGSGQIASVDYQSPPAQIPGLVLKRSEIQGSVQVMIDPSAPTPCSLLLTLEVFDSTTYTTHALVTTAVEQPLSVTPLVSGRGF